jgi:hypothetical protein
LNFAGSFRITCRAQVVYRNTSSNGEKDGVVKCGLAILDMAMDDQLKLLSLLHQTENRNSYIDAAVDMDALWNFFFETGFIYPEKYAFFQSNKGEIKRTFEKLYNHNLSIARHFTYQNKGSILGHMAMVRFYKNTWMIHHHAASKSESMRAGLEVVKQISSYVNDLSHLHSAHLNYVFLYFRAENKFPNRFFGGFARALNDQQVCSLDNFAYFHFRETVRNNSLFLDPWAVTEIRPQDFAELNGFYNHVSGGLMTEAFDLHSAPALPDELSQEYQLLGFKKERCLYSLLEADELKAIIIVVVSDIGLNMANLTNCTTVIILDDTTPRCFIDSALAFVIEEYQQQEMSVLMYPVSYAEKHSLPIEKSYLLCILKMQYIDLFMKYSDNLFHPFKNSPGPEMAGGAKEA